MIDGTIAEHTIAEITMIAEVMIAAIVEMAMIVGTAAVTIVGTITIAEEVVIAMIVDQMNVMVSYRLLKFSKEASLYMMTKHCAKSELVTLINIVSKP